MPDEPQEQVIEPTGAEPQEPTQETQPTLEELQAQLQEFSKLEETRKNEIAGLNKAISTQKNAYDELLKKTETEAETKAREAKEANELREKEQNDFLTQKAEFAKQENAFNVKVKALSLGFTEDDIEQLKFTSVEHVESTRAYLDNKIQTTKEQQAKEVESALSGKRENINTKPSEVASYPTAIDKAFK